MYTENEILFPNAVIPRLREARGPQWRELVDRVVGLPDEHPEVMAFVLMMIRLNGCLDCETDSYRAMRGCALCAVQTLRRYKGSDLDLRDEFDRALADVLAYLETQQAEESCRIA